MQVTRIQVSEVPILKSINLSKIHLFHSIDWGRYEIIDFVKIDWPLYCMASDAGIKFNHFAHKLLTFW